MANQLWTWEDLIEATGATVDGEPTAPITGVSIDSRSLEAGAMFVALRDQRDGHAFVPAAFAAGAAAALVAHDYTRQLANGPLLRVADPLAALTALARAARARLDPTARVLAVTGSVGKTGTKEMLHTCLGRLGPTHAPEKSFNNHWGVPLTLARMPQSTHYAVLEIGMNHAGEILPLTKLARPHVAIITTVEPVHLGHFPSVEAIADAKAEILDGLEAFPDGLIAAPDGQVGTAWGRYAAILNQDSPYFGKLANRARLIGADVISFGLKPPADVRPRTLKLTAHGSHFTVSLDGEPIAVTLGAPGRHLVSNALAVIAALFALNVDIEAAVPALAGFTAPAGRGAREILNGPDGSVLLIDEAYNANPASMRSALSTLALTPRSDFPRRIAIMGDMLELGEAADALHVSLLDAIEDAGVDRVFAAGPHMRQLFDRLAKSRRGDWAETSSDLEASILADVQPGDAVMVKGSLGSRMGPLVQALRDRFARPTHANDRNN